jgi:uncharacterized membrane protein
MGSGSAKKKRREDEGKGKNTKRKGKKSKRKGKKGRKEKSEKGLKYFYIGLFLYVIGLAILLFVLVSILQMMPDLVRAVDDPEFAETINVSAVGGLLAGFCAGIVFFLISFLLMFLGLLSIYSGRSEFKKKHIDSLDRGVTFIIIGILVALVGGGIGGSVAHGSGVITAFLIGFGLMYLVYEISDSLGKKLLLFAAILNVVMGFIIAAVRIWLYSTYALSNDGIEDVLSGIGPWISLIGVNSLSLIPMTVFLIGYRRVYHRVKNREVK